jgi:hypothetical protein
MPGARSVAAGFAVSTHWETKGLRGSVMKYNLIYDRDERQMHTRMRRKRQTASDEDVIRCLARRREAALEGRSVQPRTRFLQALILQRRGF